MISYNETFSSHREESSPRERAARARAASLLRLKHSLAPIFNLLRHEKPRFTAPGFVLYRQREPGSTFIRRLSALLRKRARGAWDVVVKPPNKPGVGWPLALGQRAAAWHRRRPRESWPPGAGGDFDPGINDTLNIHLLNCRPLLLTLFHRGMFTLLES